MSHSKALHYLRVYISYTYRPKRYKWKRNAGADSFRYNSQQKYDTYTHFIIVIYGLILIQELLFFPLFFVCSFFGFIEVFLFFFLCGITKKLFYFNIFYGLYNAICHHKHASSYLDSFRVRWCLSWGFWCKKDERGRNFSHVQLRWDKFLMHHIWCWIILIFIFNITKKGMKYKRKRLEPFFIYACNVFICISLLFMNYNFLFSFSL